MGPVASCPPCRGPEPSSRSRASSSDPHVHPRAKGEKPPHIPSRSILVCKHTWAEPQTHLCWRGLSRGQYRGAPCPVHKGAAVPQLTVSCQKQPGLGSSILKAARDGCQLCPFPPAALRSAPKPPGASSPRTPTSTPRVMPGSTGCAPAPQLSCSAQESLLH